MSLYMNFYRVNAEDIMVQNFRGEYVDEMDWHLSDMWYRDFLWAHVPKTYYFEDSDTTEIDIDDPDVSIKDKLTSPGTFYGVMKVRMFEELLELLLSHAVQKHKFEHRYSGGIEDSLYKDWVMFSTKQECKELRDALKATVVDRLDKEEYPYVVLQEYI